MSLAKLMKQGLFYPLFFLQGRLRGASTTLADLKAGEGAIVELKGKKVAAYKNPKGEVITLSPVCTHLGCLVGWNSAEKIWDCPCHGSRYEPDGKVKRGPAKRDLKKIRI